MAGLWPLPAAPYHGMSVEDIVIRLKVIEIETSCDTNYVNSKCKPRAIAMIELLFVGIDKHLLGLELEANEISSNRERKRPRQ